MGKSKFQKIVTALYVFVVSWMFFLVALFIFLALAYAKMVPFSVGEADVLFKAMPYLFVVTACAAFSYWFAVFFDEERWWW
jgi:hypothetical protein